MGTPYMAFGNEEISSAPDLTNPVKCHKCGKDHEIQPATQEQPNGEAFSLQFIVCDENGKTYLVGINDKDIRGRGSGGELPDE